MTLACKQCGAAVDHGMTSLTGNVVDVCLACVNNACAAVRLDSLPEPVVIEELTEQCGFGRN